MMNKTPLSLKQRIQGVEEVESLDIREPFYGGSKDPKPLPWNEIDSKTFPEAQWRIKDLVPLQGIVLFASVTGSKKSWLAMEIVNSIASGRNFLDDPRFETIGGNVLYIDAENLQKETQRRGRKLGFGKEGHKLLILNQILDLKDDYEDDMYWLYRYVEENKICTVIIDTLRGVAGGIREERAEEVRAFFNGFRQITELGTTVVFLEHLRKPALFEGKTPKKEQVFSSQDKVANADVLLLVKSDATNEEISVYQAKNRFGIEINPFKILMRDEIDEGGNDRVVLEYGGEIEESESRIHEAKEMILSFLPEGEKNTNEIIELTHRNVGEKNTRKALNELLKEGLIFVNRKTKPYTYAMVEEDIEPKRDKSSQQSKIFDSS